MLDQELMRRNIPMSKAKNVSEWEVEREKIIEAIQKEMYGFLPPKPDKVIYRDVTTMEPEEVFFNGNNEKKEIIIEVFFNGKSASFPIHISIPHKGRPCPAFLSLQFSGDPVTIYQPTEEILDRGFAVAQLCYNDVSVDAPDMMDNLCGLFCEHRDTDMSSPGKIAIWAYAASLAMDSLITMEEINTAQIAVVGHSRLGKTALLAGAMDKRFSYVISNDSGCCGAAVSRGKGGETIGQILDRFSYWFCPNLNKYRNKEETLPFDQHLLLSLIVPRKLIVASAGRDDWADPASEYLSAYAAGKIYKLYGLQFAGPDRFLKPGESFYEGDLVCHMRDGEHFQSRYDWNLFMDYICKHL